MKVIFLDVDGVLNSIHGSITQRKIDPIIDEKKVLLLKELVRNTGANLVLTSSWRCGWIRSTAQRHPLPGETPSNFYHLLCSTLEKHGMSLISETPRLPGMGREQEIRYWLSCWELDPIENFVILDDEEASFDCLRNHLVLTTLEDGLLPEQLCLAGEILNKEYHAEMC